MQNQKEGKEGTNDPAIVVVTPTEPTEAARTAEAAGAVVVPDGPNTQQAELEKLRKEVANLLTKEGQALVRQEKSLMDERDVLGNNIRNLVDERNALVKNREELLSTVCDYQRDCINSANRADKVARENAELLKLADELKVQNLNLAGQLRVSDDQCRALMDATQKLEATGDKLRAKLAAALRAKLTIKRSRNLLNQQTLNLGSRISELETTLERTYAVLGRDRVYAVHLKDACDQVVQDYDNLERYMQSKGISGVDSAAPDGEDAAEGTEGELDAEEGEDTPIAPEESGEEE